MYNSGIRLLALYDSCVAYKMWRMTLNIYLSFSYCILEVWANITWKVFKTLQIIILSLSSAPELLLGSEWEKTTTRWWLRMGDFSSEEKTLETHGYNL